MRLHRRDEGFLPTWREVRALVATLADAGTPLRVEALSPHQRLAFRQVRRRWYGVAFALPMSLLFRAMSLPPLRFLARSALNPFLVVRITRRDKA
jgi:hypothetical protein